MAADGRLVIDGTVESTIGFSYIPSGEELFIDGIARTQFSTETEYLGSGSLYLSGLNTTELASVNFLVSPTGQLITLNGEGNTYVVFDSNGTPLFYFFLYLDEATDKFNCLTEN